MDTHEIDVIISRFLDDEASLAEKSFLTEWIKDEENKAHLKDFIKTELWVRHNFDTLKVEKQLSALSIDTPSKAKGFPEDFLKYAAVFLLLACTSAYLYFQTKQPPTQILDKNSIVLEINNGLPKYYSLEDHQEFSTVASGIKLKERGVLQYFATNASDRETESKVRHTVHVPFGKTFEVILADGSNVQLNSGSSLSYPKNFGDSIRAVSLVGEGYFDIAKSNVPFQVNTENLSTKVLGTQFNVSAYDDDTEKEVILVEGFVELYQAGNEREPVKMTPNQKAALTDNLDNLAIENIDVSRHLGWTEGVLVFHNDNIATILKKMRRRFNLNTQNNYKKLNDLNFNGRFKDESMEEILMTIQAHTDFSYLLTDKTLTIDEPNKKMPMKTK
ncbi:MAG: FecR domain-containing protein [Pricia sp.]